MTFIFSLATHRLLAMNGIISARKSAKSLPLQSADTVDGGMHAGPVCSRHCCKASYGGRMMMNVTVESISDLMLRSAGCMLKTSGRPFGACSWLEAGESYSQFIVPVGRSFLVPTCETVPHPERNAGGVNILINRQIFQVSQCYGWQPYGVVPLQCAVLQWLHAHCGRAV